MNKREIGAYYEDKVCDFLREKGIEILERNYYCKFGEVDIIGRDQNTLIFFEVKFRTDDRFGNALEAIDRKKQKRIIDCAKYYMAFKDNNLFIRFDAIGITEGKLNWVKNAFGL